ncbi:hypothetical protein JM84_2713 [Dokdonia sp. Hel_I_63]|uniref:hypothetical protein n=1 Tax=Dokdonia sp. Hel_I_63 TaxID=1249996 RepID=UPI00119A3075|nr:hypothetical protein [Dokdonia sp. Hel_I_63]TVZ23759.1 hypothetical protein JM84_2713 [Dokdonia sp. Hel_I_63]
MYNFQLDEYVDSLNEDYELIMNEYSGTELFSEIIHALNWLFPDWKMNKELGCGAPEFVLSVIHNTEEIFESSCQKEFLKFLYDHITDCYDSSRIFYNDSFKMKCNNILANLTEDEFEREFGMLESKMTKKEICKSFEIFQKKLSNDIAYHFE